ncbi:MAG TPA: hypothetical protein VHF92_17650, partial [Geodermatophilus sp.]|nr:hypothetical protein [Geodermatophilus sp.]
IRADEAARAAAPAHAPAREPLAPQPPVSRAAADTLVGPTPGVSAEDTGGGGEETGGLGDLFAGEEPEDPTAGPPRAAALVPPPSARPPALPDGVPLVGPRRRPRSARRTATLVAAVLAPVVVLGVGGALLFGGEDADRPDAGAATVDAGRTAEATAAAAGPQPGDVEVVDGLTFTAEEVQVEDTCVGNAYGAVADFFAASDCTGLARALYSTDVDGRPAVVSVSVVDMGSTDGARALRALADRNGSGNVSDLLREGVRYPGGPERLSGAEYASAVSGTRVTIVETAWAAPGSGGSAADLDVVAGTSLVLPMPDPATA